MATGRSSANSEPRRTIHSLRGITASANPNAYWAVRGIRHIVGVTKGSTMNRIRILVTAPAASWVARASPCWVHGHEVLAPGHRELDLLDPGDLRRAVRGIDAVMHLATRILRPMRPRTHRPGQRTTGYPTKPRGCWWTLPCRIPLAASTYRPPSRSSTARARGRVNGDG